MPAPAGAAAGRAAPRPCWGRPSRHPQEPGQSPHHSPGRFLSISSRQEGLKMTNSKSCQRQGAPASERNPELLLRSPAGPKGTQRARESEPGARPERRGPGRPPPHPALPHLPARAPPGTRTFGERLLQGDLVAADREHPDPHGRAAGAGAGPGPAGRARRSAAAAAALRLGHSRELLHGPAGALQGAGRVQGRARASPRRGAARR